MDIIVCGAGYVGRQASAALSAQEHNVTVIDPLQSRLRLVEDSTDVRTLLGSGAHASVLREAGAAGADALLACTGNDELNLMTASIGKGVGVARSIARVHSSAYFGNEGINYNTHLNIDYMVCPEFVMGQELAQMLRNPAALATENFAQGGIEMHEFPVSPKAHVVGQRLADIRLPQGTRLAGVRRGVEAFIPDGETVIEKDDVVIFAGNRDVFHEGRKLFHEEASSTHRVVIMGGTASAVWLCRALKDRYFSIRLFEPDPSRAEVLAEKLDWVTVMQANPTDPVVFEEENIARADVFIGLTDSDEHNILRCAWAKTAGVKKTIASVKRMDVHEYESLMANIGIDAALCMRQVAVREMENLIDKTPMRRLASLAEGFIDVYCVHVGDKAEVAGLPLREIKSSQNWVVVAIQRDGVAHVPGANDVLEPDDTLLVVGRHGMEKKLKWQFDAR